MPEVHDAREEVVNGEIRIMPPCKSPHPKVVAKLMSALVRQLDDALFWILTGSFGLVIRKEPLTCRIPDLAVFERATLVEADGYFQSAPLLAVEVLSPSEDRKIKAEKLRDYESISVPEVWLISPEGRTVEILYLEEQQLRRSAILAEGLLKPRLFPGVQIDIAQIWPD